ncbi:MAG: glycosyltransferase family 4 protein [Candidatus Sericytochromatia bacterium]
MRICLVTREYPSLGSHGGIGTYTQNLVKGLASRGHDVTVIARAESGAGATAFREAGATIEPVTSPERWVLPAGNRFVGMTMRAAPFISAAGAHFQRLQRQAPFDIVEVPEYQGWGLGVAMAAKSPVVVRLHSHSKLVRRLNEVPLNADTRLVCALEAASIRRGDAVMSNSQALAVAMAADYGYPLEKIGVLPLGIDTDRFQPTATRWLRAHLGLPDDAPILLYVGRLERRKGVEVMIDAFAKLRERHPDATLLLAGFSTDTGPGQASLLDYLKRRAGALGALDGVRFLGHVPYDELPRYYSGCDVFLAPSLYEPFGMVYLEAMACGKVAVGCDAGGVPEIIQHGQTGILVPPGDVESLAQALGGLVGNPDRRRAIGERARQSVLQHFSLPVIAERTEARYAEAIAVRQARRAGAWGRVGYAQGR